MNFVEKKVYISIQTPSNIYLAISEKKRNFCKKKAVVDLINKNKIIILKNKAIIRDF